MKNELTEQENEKLNDGILFNYCLMDNRDFMIERVFRSIHEKPDFDINCYYFMICGLPKRYKVVHTSEVFSSDLHRSFSTVRELKKIFDEAKCRYYEFSIEVDNSRQYGFFFTPSEESPSPLVIAKKIDDTYQKFSHSPNKSFAATSVSSCYSGVTSLHLAFEEARRLNNYAYYRPDIKAFSKEVISPSNLNPLLLHSALSRFRKDLCRPTEADAQNDLQMIFNKIIRKTLSEADLQYAGDFINTIFLEYCTQYKIDLNIQKPHSFPFIDEYLKYLKECVSILFEEMPQKRYSADIISVLYALHNSWQDDLSLTLLANALGVSASRLSTAFNQETGSTFTEKLNQERLIHIKEELITTKDHINEIAARNGMPNFKYFSRYFKETTGTTPTAYRKKHQDPGNTHPDRL